MKESVTGSRGSQGRRTISTFTWIGLAIAAGLLWFARVQGDTATVASEPVALLLAAYAGFSSIFAWMMFAPRRRSSEESPLLFVFGGITLLAPGIIAFFLMPPHSPLRGWLTVGIFLITVVAVMSPVPERFFAVPRDRASYLRPISDSLFSNLNYRDQLISFEHLGSSTSSGSAEPVSASEWRREARDPWLDPFKGTGLEPTRPKARIESPLAGNPVGIGTSGTTLRDDQSSRSAAGQRGAVSPPAAPVSRRVPQDIPLQTGRRPSGVFPPIPARPTSVPLPSVPLPSVPLPSVPLPPVPLPPAARAPVPRVSVPQTEHLPPAVSIPKSSPQNPVVSKPPVSQPPVSKPAIQPVARTESSAIGYRTPPIEARVPPAIPRSPAAKPPAITSVLAVPQISVPVSARDSGAGAAKNPVVSRPASAVPIQRVPSAPAIIVARPATGFGFRPTVSTTSRSSVSTAAASIAGTAATVVSHVAETPSPSVSSFAATNGGARTGPSIHADNSDDADNTDARPDSGIKFERIQDDFGGEMIEGTIRVLFEPGQKRAHLHVPFSPPLPGIPEVEVETVGDEQLRLKVGVRQSYGIRIEARRSEASERLETEIGFAAVCSRSGAR